MIDNIEIKHHIQRHILSVLMHVKVARFRDMRPPHTDTNLYSYHLKLLLKQNMVAKTDGGYMLGRTGLIYIDRLNQQTLKYRTQPKIVTMLVLQNPDGDVLLYQRTRQPYLAQWTLPMGKVHIDDTTIAQAAHRELREKAHIDGADLVHAGDCYIRVVDDDDVQMSTLVHVFYGEAQSADETECLRWARPHKLDQFELAPAVEQIIARTFFRDPFFFEEYTVPLADALGIIDG